MADIVALRCYPELRQRDPPRKWTYKTPPAVLVFDTETTTDPTQTLLFGSCAIWIRGRFTYRYLFLRDDLPESDQDIIQEVGEEQGWRVMSLSKFIKYIFYPWAYEARAIIVAFNLPFDIAHIAKGVVHSRGRDQGGFTFILSQDQRHPRVVVRSLDSKRAFIHFQSARRKKSKTKYQHHRGHFLDLKTAAFTLTNRSYTLADACDAFECELGKGDPPEHGIITKEYVEYNIRDTLATYELFTKLQERYDQFNLEVPLHRMYSPASIGKAILRQMGVQ